MPKREDDFWASQKEGLRYCAKHKRYYRADVGCQICMFERLGTKLRGQQHLRLPRCPDCHEHSLFWNDGTQLYECMNLKCKHTFNKSEFEARKLQVQAEEPDESRKEEENRPGLQQCPVCKKKSLFWNSSTQLYECLNVKCKRRLTEAELILARQGKLELTSKPEKSVAHEIRKPTHIPATKPKKSSTENAPLAKCVFISLISLAALLFGLVRIGTWLNWFSLPWIEGWGEIFIWFLPFEIVLIILGISGIGWVLSHAGFWRGIFTLVSVTAVCGLATMVVAPDTPNILLWSGEDGERMEELIEPGIFSVVVGADGHRVWLHNNPAAVNPTWEELMKFLKDDETDQKPYGEESFVCADFAEMLHNNAEKAGIRAAYVVVEFPIGEGHALNAFRTKDRGLIYIDCTGSNQGINADKTVDVKVGRRYAPVSVFPEPGWVSNWDNLGTVCKVAVKW